MREAGVLHGMVMVFGQMNEPPGARFRVGHAARNSVNHLPGHARKFVIRNHHLFRTALFQVNRSIFVRLGEALCMFTRANWLGRIANDATRVSGFVLQTLS